MKNYLKDLEKELKKLKISDKEIKEIISDHLEMFEEAEADGVSDEELNSKFGSPESVAKQIYTDNFESRAKSDVDPSVVPEEIRDYELYKSFPVISGVEKISVGLISEDFLYIPYEGDQILVYAQNLKNPDHYQVSFVENEFLLKRTKGKNLKVGLFGTNSSADFAIMVPKEINLSEFVYHTISGDGFLDKVSAESVEFKTTSGDIELTNVISENHLNLTSVSGDFNVSGVQCKQLEISLVSGDFECNQARVERDITINTVSGDVEMKDVSCQHIQFRTVSGDFEGEEVYPESVEMKSVSGDFEIENKNHDNEIIITSKKSLSGDVNIR